MGKQGTAGRRKYVDFDSSMKLEIIRGIESSEGWREVMASCHVDYELSMIPRNGRTNHDFLWQVELWRNFLRDRHWENEISAVEPGVVQVV